MKALGLRKNVSTPPLQHAQSAQGVPTARLAARFQVEELLAGMALRRRPGAIVSALAQHPLNGLAETRIARRRDAPEIIQPAQHVVLPARRIGQLQEVLGDYGV